MLVVIEHTVFFGALSIGKSWDNYLPINIGTYGVLLFFLISGAAMCIASEKSDAWTFWLRRVARIYPPFLLSLLLGSIIIFIFSNGQKPDFHFDFSLLLFPAGTGNSTFGVPYWTLIYEMFFYNVVAALLLFRLSSHHRNLFMVAWCILVILVSGAKDFGGFALPKLSQILLSPMCAFFCAGYVLMYSKKYGINHFWPLAIGVCAASIVHYNAHPTILIYLISTIVPVVLALRWMSPPEWTVKMGDYSYGIYLMHCPVVYSFYLAGIGSTKAAPETFGIYFFSAITVASLFGFTEYEAHKRILKPRKTKMPQPITTHSVQSQ